MNIGYGSVQDARAKSPEVHPTRYTQKAIGRALKKGRLPSTSTTSWLYGKLKIGSAAVDTFSRLHDRFQFDNRMSNAPVLVCMLAGYKPDLWPLVLPRFRRALPQADVCIVSPGLHNDHLAAICRSEGWSYLSTTVNDVALAQNICYRLHVSAEMIVKVDEDMFMLSDTISDLLMEYKHVKAAGVVDPAFVAPIIPLNGFCYRYLLEVLGLLDAYQARFGPARLATTGLPIHTSADAAQWIWKHTGPLTQTAERLRSTQPRHLYCPIQFSIGLIAFERQFWESIGYLKVNRRRLLAGINTLGGDEAYLCSQALETSRPVVITTGALAGHFAFGPQYSAQLNLLNDRPDIFDV